jgi:hypothetical protein
MTNKSKYTSLNTIIAKVYRDMGMSDELDISDAIEWGAEAIELIGSAYSLLDKSEILQVVEGKAQLPCDLHYVRSIKGYSTETEYEDCYTENIPWTQMRYSTDVFHKHRYCCEAEPSTGSCGDYTYILNDDYIFPSFISGYVYVAYKGIPTDENGWPLVPDDIKFKNAVAYHIMMKLAFIKWMTGSMGENVYRKIEQERDWYIGAAQTRGHMPSIDMMESIKNNILRLIPKINQHSDGFASSGSQEQRNNLSSIKYRNR